jgi:hypothetical protein
MTHQQLDRLHIIDAHLTSLLDLAAKRTAGKWTLGDENNSHYEICMGDAIATIDRQDRYGLHMAISREEMRANGGFIMDCAGNAEAGWKATKAIIKGLSNYSILDEDMKEVLNEILAAWNFLD